MRHKLYLDNYTQKGKNRITLPKALADYYGNTATAYVNGRQVESQTGGYALSFDGVNDIASATFSNGSLVDKITLKFYSPVNITDDSVGYSSILTVGTNIGVFSVGGYGKNPTSETLTVGATANNISYIRDTISVGWHTVVAEWDGSKYAFNLDGTDRTVYTYGAPGRLSFDNELSFGKRIGYEQYWQGKLAYAKLESSTAALAEYKFNEGSGSVTDYSGNGYDLSVTGATWEFTTEKNSTDAITFTTPTPTREIEIGRGNLELTDVEPDTENWSVLSFDGVNDVASTTFSDGSLVNKITLKFYSPVNVTDDSFSYSNILTVGTNIGVFCVGSYGSYPTSETLTVGATAGNISYIRDTISVGWHTVVAEWDGSKYAFNLDGADRTVYTYGTPGRLSFDNELSFGKRIGYETYWQGKIAYAKLESSTDTLAEYKFDEGSGGVTDYSGNGYDLSVTGATWEFSDDVPIPIKTPEVLHWTPSSESGYYWVLTEDGNGIFVKAEGIWVKGSLFVKLSGEWVECEPKVRDGGVWL
jgi:hypothetical protein